ncbi:MAG: recombinase family protein [Azospirillaceae bacterium]|nr:recombinase family protein [Azospirillaceae bacterium]MDE1147036.1 recombinase family protein [Azospirillaceae bacterium]MDE1148636.1 recombinase family protein [Azospirillaceae bacterium]MDE1150195.1 recombinase family protein [Azospirillaceae bacterium]
MNKITPDHLARRAYIYVRQSSADQLLHNHESRRRQYGLADRARQLGWTDVVVIDDDLGRSGGGIARPGFERLLGAICEGRVGIVLAIEASRLARNGRDWHTLLEFCGLVDCLLADEDGVYDARLPNDRLVLGMKGTMSEMELSILRQRSLEALRQKARRGELFLTVAVGYVKTRHDRIALNPDQRVREALALVFRKFAEFQSIRQVHLWLRQEQIRLPAVEQTADGPRIAWKLPVYNTIHHLLTNPVYGGAYVFGRTGSRVSVRDGRKHVVRGFRRAQSEWEVLIPEHHEGYISWAEFGRNQALIADNANGKGLMARGSVRRGDALLAGLLRCGHCGRRLHVSYSGTGGYCVRYNCRGAHINHGSERCISFGGLRVDGAVATEVLRFLAPLGIEAALQAIEAREAEGSEARRQTELALTQARYEAELARRQYDAVDPGNRLVAAELERRWNDRLVEVHRLEERIGAFDANPRASFKAQDRARLMALGADIHTLWHHAGATAETRKRILRTVIIEIVARVAADTIHLTIHWQGGDHTSLTVPKNQTGKHRWRTDADTGDLIRTLARQQPDGGIAAILNRAGKRTGKGNSWTEARVRSFRSAHGIAVYREGEIAERGELTLEEAATRLQVSKMTVLRLIAGGAIQANQACKGAPWAIPEAQLSGLNPAYRPVTKNPDQKTFDFQ